MNKAFLILVCLLFGGCTHMPTPAERQQAADALAKEHAWRSLVVPAGEFDLLAYLPIVVTPSERLAIYIEGDGLAWINSSQPSANPTPRDPIGLRLALAQHEGAAAYLARPCQYVGADTGNCSKRYWTDSRFAPPVVAATNRAIDVLKQRFAASRLTLVGYSGGAAVAALVAARRKDVDRLVTVAGNLDHRAWTTYHKLQPLDGSLNPADEKAALKDIRQWHFVGLQDKIIPPSVAEAFTAEMANARVIPTNNFDHRCCWADTWEDLWKQIQ